MTDPIIHKPGIYFGISNEEHHADPALGSSHLKRLLTSGPDYWWQSHMNPARPKEDEKSHLSFGRAVHAMVLEGREAFDQIAMREPDPERLLVSVADMDAFMEVNSALLWARAKEAGLDLPKRAVKADKAAFITQLFPEVRVLDLIKADADARGVTIFSAEEYDRILVAGTMITANPELAAAFTGGASEVSVFWEQDMGEGEPPIRCKARFDYLKVRAVGDLKSINNSRGLPFPVACRNAMASYRYDVQAAHYMEGRSVVPELVKAGAVFGEHDPDWLARVAASEEYAMVFVFYQSVGAPITWGTQISLGSPVLEIGAISRRTALDTFATFMKRYGTEAAWVLTDPVSELDMNDLPRWWGMN